MNITRADIAKFSPAAQAAIARQLGQAAPVADAPAVPRDPYRSDLERRYAAYLDTLKAAGVVEWWAYEAVRLRIADGKREAFFKPDFAVQFADGRLEMHETKGYWKEAARLRIKVAAGLYPWKFIAIQRDGAGWKREDF